MTTRDSDVSEASVGSRIKILSSFPDVQLHI
jgi:hypothetical protein